MQDIVMVAHAVCDRSNLAGHLARYLATFVRSISNHINPKISSTSLI